MNNFRGFSKLDQLLIDGLEGAAKASSIKVCQWTQPCLLTLYSSHPHRSRAARDHAGK